MDDIDQSLGKLPKKSEAEIEIEAKKNVDDFMEKDNPFYEDTVRSECERLQNLQDKQTRMTIAPGPNAADPVDKMAALKPDAGGTGVGSGTDITYNPTLTDLNPPGNNSPAYKFPADDSPGVVPLGHEAIHTGRNAQGEALQGYAEEAGTVGLPGWEEDTLTIGKQTITENSLRQQIYGDQFPQRTEYQTNYVLR